MAVERWQREGYSIGAMRALAQRALPHPVFDFADGGAEDETTLRRNESAYQQWDLLPRPLEGAASRDLSVELFGRRLALPVMVGPTGLDLPASALVGDEDGDFAGGSYVVVQKYLHDMAAWKETPTHV